MKYLYKFLLLQFLIVSVYGQNKPQNVEQVTMTSTVINSINPKETALKWRERIQKEIVLLQQIPEYSNNWSALISKSVTNILTLWLEDDSGLDIQETPPLKLPPDIIITQEKWESDKEYEYRLNIAMSARQLKIDEIQGKYKNLIEIRNKNIAILNERKAQKIPSLILVANEFTRIAVSNITPKIIPYDVIFDKKTGILYIDLDIGGQAIYKFAFKETAIELRKIALTDINKIEIYSNLIVNDEGQYGVTTVKIKYENLTAFGEAIIQEGTEKNAQALFNLNISKDNPKLILPTPSLKHMPVTQINNKDIEIPKAVDVLKDQTERIKISVTENSDPIEKVLNSKSSTSYISKLSLLVKSNINFLDSKLLLIKGNPEAEVEVTCNPKGEIINKKLIQSSGNPAWDEAVLISIDKTRILPSDENGYISPKITFSFRPRD